MDKEGLHITPKLPATDLTSLGIENFNYWNMGLNISVTNTSVRIKAVSNDSKYNWVINGTPVSGLFDQTVTITPGQTVTLQKSPNSNIDPGTINPNYYNIKLGEATDVTSKYHTWDYVKPINDGLNAITISVYSYGGHNPSASDGTGAIIGEVTFPDGSKIYTDSSWKVSSSVSGDITDPDYDDTSWSNATSYGGYGVSPWGNMVPGMSNTQGKWIWTSANMDELVPIAVSSSTASSEIYPSANAWDNNTASCWSSNGYTESSSTESITLDLGSNKDVRGVSLTPRSDGAFFPVDFSIQTSSDGTNFTTVSGQNYINYTSPGADTRNFKFTDPVNARYVRVCATKLSGMDGSYYFQLAEFKANEIRFSPNWVATNKLPVSSSTASSTGAGYQSASAYDGNLGSVWSSEGHSGEANTEYITVDLGSLQDVGSIKLAPKSAGQYFPADFSIQYSADGTSFTTVPGQKYTKYPFIYAPKVFSFTDPVKARYIRINATKLRGDKNGMYYFQLAEAEFFGESMTAFASSPSPNTSATISSSTASSEIYPSTNTWDNSSASCWSSYGHYVASSPESITLDLGIIKDVKGVSLTPRSDGAFFPVDFSIQTSSDGINFTTVPGQDYMNYANPGAATQSFNFTDPVKARYVRINASKLSGMDGVYYCQLAEVKIYADSGLSLATVSSSTASSEIYPSTNTWDNNTGSCWSSYGHTEASSTESITFDLDSNKDIKGVSLTPRSDGVFFPVDFSIQTSSDGIDFTTVPSQDYINYANPGAATQNFTFTDVVNARYVRINATKLSGVDGSYYFQLAEVKIYENNTDTSTPNQTSGANKVLDKDSWDSYLTYWESDEHNSESAVEWIALDMKNVRNINSILVQPSYDASYWPVDFKFQYSNDSVNWTDIPGASYVNYPKPGINFSNRQIFTFTSTVSARYIRMYATRLSTCGGGIYRTRIVSMMPNENNIAYMRKTFYSSTTPQPVSSVSASSTAGAGYEASMAIDGNVSTVWSSTGYVTDANTDSLCVDVGSVEKIKQIRLTPGQANCFPIDFKFQYSTNGKQWKDIEGLEYKNYGDPGTLTQTFTIRKPVNARYVRLVVTRSRMASNGLYYTQIAEMKLDK